MLATTHDPRLTTHQPCLFDGAALRPNWPFGGIAPMSADLIMADPPWQFALYSAKGEEKSAQAQYATMPTDAICRLPVADLAKRDCLLWLWCTWPMLEDGIAVLKAWGFAYVTGGAWHKTTARGKTAFGTGYRLRSACEPILIGTVGSPETTASVRNIVVGQAREHSRKPEEAYAAAERLMPHAQRIDLFSRLDRPGWTSWGNEAGKFNGV